jgi:hypothetical protein
MTPPQQMDDVVEDRNLEVAQQHCFGIMTGEGHGLVIGGDPGHEPKDTDHQENGAHSKGHFLHVRA